MFVVFQVVPINIEGGSEGSVPTILTQIEAFVVTMTTQTLRGKKCSKIELVRNRGNKFRFWQIFMEALEEFPNIFIQSETSMSTHEYSESNRASKYVMLLSNFGNQHRGLNWYLFPRTRLMILFFLRISQVSPSYPVPVQSHSESLILSIHRPSLEHL